MYHPNVKELSPISLEREHSSREFIPYRYAKFAIQGVDDLIFYIETCPDAERGLTEGNLDSEVNHPARGDE